MQFLSLFRLFLIFGLFDLIFARQQTSAQCAPEPPGGLVWLKVDGNSTDVLGHDTSEINPQYTDGIVGQSLNCSGSSEILVADFPELDTPEFTIETWIYPTAYVGYFSNIASKESGVDLAHLQFAMGIKGPTGQGYSPVPVGNLCFFLGGISGLPNDSSGWVDGLAAIALNQWTHVALAVSANSVTVYLNGTPTRTLTGLSGGLATSSGPLRVGGRDPQVPSEWFSGRIDEFGFYSRALGTTEILSIAAAGTNGKCSQMTSIAGTAPAAVDSGTPFTASFVITNGTVQAAENIVVTITVPNEVTALTNGSSRGTFQWVDNRLITRLGSLAPGDTAEITLTCQSVVVSPVVLEAQLELGDPSDPPISRTTVSTIVNNVCLPSPAGLSVWLRGENNINDELGHTVLSQSPLFADGYVGRALNFTGGDGLQIPDEPSMDGSEFTIETWINPTSLPGFVNSVASKESGVDLNLLQFGLGVKGSLYPSPSPVPTGHLLFFLGGVSGLPNDFSGWVDSQTFIPTRHWTHVALTVNSNTATIYVNGAVARSVSGFSGHFALAQGPLRIGSRTPQTPSESFFGSIDEFSFYSRNLSKTEIANIFAAGRNGKCQAAFPVTVTGPPVDQVVTNGNPATLSVGAAGTPPLTYHWLSNHIAIIGATNSQLVLPAVTLAEAGFYSVVVCNASGCAPEVGAQLFVERGSAIIQVGTVTVDSLESVDVPVRIIGNGVEGAVSLSLQFDPSLLQFVSADVGADVSAGQFLVNAPTNSPGKIGLALALPAGFALADGANEIIRLTFTSAFTSAGGVSPLRLVNSPTALDLVDANAKELPFRLQNGQVIVTPVIYEADVAPVPGGDERVTVGDWVQIGRYVAALDDVPTNLFQRADCAPLATKGDGVLTVIDWVQAGRFTAGLDPLIPVGGPTSPVQGSPGIQGARLQGVSPRSVTLVASNLLVGIDNPISVVISATGQENAVAFSVQFDPTLLTFDGYLPGTGLKNASVNVNSRHTADGRVGVALALSSGNHFPPGNLEMLRLRFTPTGTATNPVNLSFSDTPIYRQISDPLAQPLTTSWNNTSAAVSTPSLNVGLQKSDTNAIVLLSWSTQWTGALLQSATNALLPNWVGVTNSPTTNSGTIRVTVPASVNQSLFRLKIP